MGSNLEQEWNMKIKRKMTVVNYMETSLAIKRVCVCSHKFHSYAFFAISGKELNQKKNKSNFKNAVCS